MNTTEPHRTPINSTKPHYTPPNPIKLPQTPKNSTKPHKTKPANTQSNPTKIHKTKPTNTQSNPTKTQLTQWTPPNPSELECANDIVQRAVPEVHRYKWAVQHEGGGGMTWNWNEGHFKDFRGALLNSQSKNRWKTVKMALTDFSYHRQM